MCVVLRVSIARSTAPRLNVFVPFDSAKSLLDVCDIHSTHGAELGCNSTVLCLVAQKDAVIRSTNKIDSRTTYGTNALEERKSVPIPRLDVQYPSQGP